MFMLYLLRKTKLIFLIKKRNNILTTIMEFEKKMIINALLRTNGKGFYLPKDCPMMFMKDTERSTLIRKEGNKLFSKKQHSPKLHEQIWKFYTNSIAVALNGSEELAAAYANRSALLIHLRKYEDCLQDIDRALKITMSDCLKVKLFCRKTECFVALQEGKQRSTYEKAKYWLNKVKNEKNKVVLIEMVNKIEKVLDNNILLYQKKNKKQNIQCANDTVSITYNPKYGRYLIANRDVQIGEFVCVEKFYVASVNSRKSYAYCSHCLGISWTTIPCDKCAIYMYCSEKCKKEAWTKYHDIECSINLNVDCYLYYYIQLSVRSLIMGIKEAGSIKKLKDLLNDIEKCSDKKTKGFSTDGKFLDNSFRSLYSLSHAQTSDKLGYYIESIIHILNILIEKTKIFGKDFNLKKCSKLREHEDVVFIGSLLLRLILIFTINAFYVIDPNNDCKKNNHPLYCARRLCCPRGLSLSPLTSLINHNCDNNVGKFYTNDGRVAYFSLKPIKKGSQIFSAYYTNYIKENRKARKRFLSDMYDFVCDCIPCKKNWTPLDDYELSLSELSMTHKEFMLCHELMTKNADLIEPSKHKKQQCDEKIISAFAEDVETLLKNIPQPSFILQSFLLKMHVLFEKYYGAKLKIPKKCKTTST